MNPPPFTIGHGYDIHRLQGGGVLMLGGVQVAEGISPIAHSDGDVVIHAVVDAILGALGRSDIGEHFPDSDPKWKDAASMKFLAHAMETAHAGGWYVGNVDVIVLLERPKIKSFKAAMGAVLSKAVGAPVNIKAGTNEGCDAIGRGEAIAAHAVVLLHRAV
ncbi:2-C-methyl-D-erythritol 2,4-cyclodiphosphate synthase [soil metagenome]